MLSLTPCHIKHRHSVLTWQGLMMDNIVAGAHVLSPACAQLEQGVKEYEPRVVNQLLDFVYRYVCDVLQDAEVCCRMCLSMMCAEASGIT